MKRIFATILLFLVIGNLFFANYLMPFVLFFTKTSYNFALSQYIFVITSYFCIVMWVWIEHDKLEEFHIDRFSLAILIIFGIFRGSFKIPGEIYLKITIFILSLVLDSLPR